MDDYRGKVVFITGAASGIGQELARQLVTLGAHVVLTDRDGEGCRLVAESLAQGAEPEPIAERPRRTLNVSCA